MNEWQKTVAKYTRLHKGKSLTEILPLAKAEYRKTHKVGKIAKKRGRKQRGGNSEAMEGSEVGAMDSGAIEGPAAYSSNDLFETNKYEGDTMKAGKKSKKRHHKKKRHTKKKRGRKTR